MGLIGINIELVAVVGVIACCRHKVASVDRDAEKSQWRSVRIRGGPCVGELQ